MVAEEQLSSVKAAPEEACRMKFLCSYGGKILPKADGQLRYVGGDTRLVSFNKNIGFADLIAKLEKLFGPNLSFKYQLPNEDLDTLISVTCDEDVVSLVEEYDKNESRDGASRLRAFLFPRTGLPPHHIHACSCQAMEEVRSPVEHKCCETVSSPCIQGPEISCLSASAFPVPDYLDVGYNTHISQYQQHEVDDQRSPTHTANDKVSVSRSVRTPLPMQVDYSRQHNSKFIDVGGRGPALTTSALGPLSSSHHFYHHAHQQLPQQPQHYQVWEIRKPWDEGLNVNQHEEKRHVELNSEAHHDIFRRDVGIGIPMIRIPSRERIVPNAVDGITEAQLMMDRHTRSQALPGITDSHVMMDRQTRSPVLPRVDLHFDMPESHLDARQDIALQGSSRYFKPPESHRIPGAGTEISLGSPLSPMLEKCADSCRNSGDSDEGKHLHSAVDNMVHSHTGGRHDETLMSKQQKYGEFEAQHDSQLHNLGKSHFQQVYWQARDSHEQQQQPLSNTHEGLRVGHNTHAIQRHGQPLEFHTGSPSGLTTHHQHTTWTTMRPDALPNTRAPSPLYMQGASGTTSHPDPTSPRRGQTASNNSHPSSPRRGQIPNSTSHPASPRRGQIQSKASYLPSCHGVRIHPLQEMSYLTVNKAQQLPNQFFSDAVEAHHRYDQNGSLFVEEGIANYDSAINQAHYFDKIIVANQEETMNTNNNVEAQLLPVQQYTRLFNNNQETQGLLPQ